MRSAITVGLGLLLATAPLSAGDVILVSEGGQPNDSVPLFDGSPEDAVAADGACVAYGNGNRMVGANFKQGGVTIWRDVGGSWEQQGLLSAEFGHGGDLLGAAIALSGDVLVAGAPHASLTGTNYRPGLAWVFRWNGATWVEEQRLDQLSHSDNDLFGFDVAVHGDVAVVSAPWWGEAPFFEDVGRAYVYRHDGATWLREATLGGTNQPFEFFGESVAVHGDWVMVGGQNSDPFPSLDPVGAVYAYRYDGSAWTLEQIIQNPDGATGDHFGASLGFDGDTLVVGDPFFGANGSLIEFTWDGAQWAKGAVLTLPTSTPSNRLGHGDIDVRGDLLVVGDASDSVAGVSFQGAAWAFRRHAGVWDEGLMLTGSDDQGPSTWFAAGVALTSTHAAIASPGSLDGQGTLHVVELPGDAWASLGHALGGVADLPGARQLGELTPGAALTLELDRARPDTLAVLVVGAGTLDAPFKGGVLVPAPTLLRGFPTDADGRVRLDLLWPAGVPTGFEVFTQWWIPDAAGPSGYAASNAVRGTAG